MTLDEIRRRPTLPGRFQPSTISVLRLNFCVRDGNRWIPQAIVTGNMGLFGSCAPALPSLAFRLRFALLRVASPCASSDSLRSRFPFPRTLKTAQVRFRSAPSDQDFPSLLALTFSKSFPRSQVSFPGPGFCFRFSCSLFTLPCSLLSKIKPSTD